MTTAVRVRGVSKEYRLGELRGYRTLRESLMSVLTLPGRKGHGVHGCEDSVGANDDRIWALKDVSFDVAAGEVLGIIGANGAGKTTLLKILSRITEPTAGEVELFGRVSSLLEVGTGFHPELTGRENIFLNGSILGMRRREIAKKFDEIVDFSGVERFLDTPVKRYSSGMQVRLAFAVAAHLEPEILLVDEVLAVGDAEFQRKCLGKMGDIAGGGRTILFVSHNMAAVRNLCPRGLLLQQGGIHQNGRISECIQTYLDTTNHIDSLDQSIYLDQANLYRNINKNKPVSSVPMGEGISVAITFHTPSKTSKPRVGIMLRRRLTGENIFGINTELVGEPVISRPADRFRALLEINTLNLIHGDYFLDVYLGDEHKNFEVVHGILPFSITEADVFGTGRLPQPNWGPIYVTPRLSLVVAE